MGGKIKSFDLDKRYYARCIRQLQRWNAPLEGWYCTDIYAFGEDDEDDFFTCELCGCSHVRNVHVMEHDLYFEKVEVGCICAGFMEGDIYKAQERERKMKNRTKRRKNFLKHEWKHEYPDVWVRVYRKNEIEIRRHSGEYVVLTDGKKATTYKGKIITDFYSAIYAAFELADPKEAVL